MKIVHYRNKCIGCNSCVEHAPDFWRISLIDGKAELIQGIQRKEAFVREISPFELEQNLKAQKDCPMNIIKVCK